MYRANGIQRRQTLGTYPALTLADARKLARKAFAQVAEGKDPSMDKRLSREKTPAGSFVAVATEYLERYARRHKKSWQSDERLIRVELTPLWAKRRLAEIGKADVLSILDKTADRAPILANRLLALLRKLFGWSVERGYIEISPCAGIKAPSKERVRERTLTDDEIRRLQPAFDRLGYPFGPLFATLLLTGQRVNEVAGMSWDELDFERQIWRLAAERTKPGRPHAVPLSAPVMALLGGLPRLGGLVFTTSGDRPVSGFSRAKARLDNLTGLAGWRLHDLRRTAATNLARLGTAPHVVSAILNHAPQGVTRQVYDRYSYEKEMREALERWAACLKGGADVVPLRAVG
jgi:integrase